MRSQGLHRAAHSQTVLLLPWLSQGCSKVAVLARLHQQAKMPMQLYICTATQLCLAFASLPGCSLPRQAQQEALLVMQTIPG